MTIRSYSPSDVQILLGGFYQLSGFVEDSFIKISKDIEPYSITRTADGRTARTHRKDGTYTVTLSLASTSPANDVLMKIHQVDELTQLGKFPLFIKDSLGSSLFLAPTCWITQVPDLEFASNITTRRWSIQASNATLNIGGNAGPTSVLEDATTILANASPAIRNILGV